MRIFESSQVKPLFKPQMTQISQMKKMVLKDCGRQIAVPPSVELVQSVDHFANQDVAVLARSESPHVDCYSPFGQGESSQVKARSNHAKFVPSNTPSTHYSNFCQFPVKASQAILQRDEIFLSLTKLTKKNQQIDMADDYDSVRKKVAAIYSELAGERARPLDGSALPTAITEAIAVALSNADGSKSEILRADEVAFHLTDWNSDAAFLVALHLFPERFTQEEIRVGVDLFLVHVPSHVIAAARLTGNSIEDVFADEDEK